MTTDSYRQSPEGILTYSRITDHFSISLAWQPCLTRKNCLRETRALPLFCNLPAPPQNLRFGSGGFSFLDVAVAIVE